MSPPALDGRGFLLKKSCGTPSSPFSKKPGTPVERFEAKNSRWPSRESAGAKSATELLTVDPRLTGVPHGQLSSAQARWETQMLRSKFTSPGASGRVEAKYRLTPSLESAACWSL